MAEEKEQTTTIKITTKTRDRIQANGEMGDTYEEVINKALNALEKRRVK